MKKGTFLLLALLGSGLLWAHEYILIASDFFLKKGENMEVHLFVADGFNVEMERPFQPEITKSFMLHTEKGTVDLVKESTKDRLPIIDRKVDFDGLALIGMERHFAHIELENEAFLDYLKEDNIEGINIDRNKSVQKERYARSIKALLCSGEPSEKDQLYKKVLGHKFEIVMLQNPYLLKEGDWFKAQVLFDGKPLTDRAITARNRLGNQAAFYQYARTDVNGICAFKLNRAGEWFLHATYMQPSSEPAKADWESYWTSFSFGAKE